MEDKAFVSILDKLEDLPVEANDAAQIEEVFKHLKTINEKLMLVNNNLAGIYDVMEETDQ